jgi:hypothetical protein
VTDFRYKAFISYSHQDEHWARWLAQVEDYSLSEPPVRSCKFAGLAARQAVMRGDLASAGFYTDYLLGKGYYEPAFIRFCQAYDLCD